MKNNKANVIKEIRGCEIAMHCNLRPPDVVPVVLP